MITVRDVRLRRPRPERRHAADVDAAIPASPPPSYRGGWAGWYLRALLRPFCGDDTRDVVIGAMGPGVDYEPIHHRPAAELGGGRRVERW